MTGHPWWWLGRPISRRVPLRRSTALLIGGFVGLGLLYLGVRSDPEDDPDQQIVVVPATAVESVPVESVPTATSVASTPAPETSPPPVTAPSTPAPPATEGESEPTVD